MNEYEISIIKEAIEKKKRILIQLRRDGKIADSAHRDMIDRFIERAETPDKPQTIQSLMKQFMCSACSYSVINKQITSQFNNGQVPLKDDYPSVLSKLFNQSVFLSDETWKPSSLISLSQEIQDKNNYDLDSKKLEPRVLAVLLTGAEQIQKETGQGLSFFYSKVDDICSQGGTAMWDYASTFSAPIKNVGVALACDFLKEIGYVRFVKIDFHMIAEIPKLTGQVDGNKLSQKSLFIKTQEIADGLNMSPFHLDKLLYVWGWAKKFNFDEQFG